MWLMLQYVCIQAVHLADLQVCISIFRLWPSVSHVTRQLVLSVACPRFRTVDAYERLVFKRCSQVILDSCSCRFWWCLVSVFVALVSHFFSYYNIMDGILLRFSDVVMIFLTEIRRSSRLRLISVRKIRSARQRCRIRREQVRRVEYRQQRLNWRWCRLYKKGSEEGKSSEWKRIVEHPAVDAEINVYPVAWDAVEGVVARMDWERVDVPHFVGLGEYLDALHLRVLAVNGCKFGININWLIHLAKMVRIGTENVGRGVSKTGLDDLDESAFCLRPG